MNICLVVWLFDLVADDESTDVVPLNRCLSIPFACLIGPAQFVEKTPTACLIGLNWQNLLFVLLKP
jgi:hypothetical protein